jgi:hypothetical protein
VYIGTDVCQIYDYWSNDNQVCHLENPHVGRYGGAESGVED